MINQWARIARRNKERMLLIAQESAVYVATSTMEKSPVDTGLFRNNWFSGINQPNVKTVESRSKLPFGSNGGVRIKEFKELTTQMNIGDSIFFTNSLPYSRRLEFGWSKKMAPLGMVRVSAAQFPLFVNKVARKIT